MVGRIYYSLPIGEDNAVPRRELMVRTGLNDRQLRRAIEDERRAGYLICSSVDCKRGGYYRHDPKKPAELREYVRQMEKHARSTFYTLHNARAELKRIEAEQDGEA